MTMKTMTIAAAALALSIAGAATPLEIGKKVNLMKKETWQGVVTQANIQEVYDALKATNDWTKADAVAAIGLTFGNQDLYLDYAANVPNTCGAKITNFDTWNAGRANGQPGTLTKQFPELGLAMGKKWIERGDYDNASIIFFWVPTEKNAWAPMFTAETRAYIAEKFTPEVVMSLKYIGSYINALIYFSKVDALELNDDSEPTMNRYWNVEKAKYVVDSCGASYYALYTKTRYIDFCKLNAQFAERCNVRIKAAKALDARLKTKDASAGIWDYVFANGTWVEKVELAFYLNDTDKIIDAFKTVGTDATPEQLNKLIPIINGLDYKYRAAEVLDILKNINSKYTLKLYDDRDTWEPILSKIRAMIDAR